MNRHSTARFNATEITKTEATYNKDIWVYNNAVMFLFDDICYEVNGMEIDRCKNPGITTVMKVYPSWNNGSSTSFLAPSTSKEDGLLKYLTEVKEQLACTVLLEYIFGFAEDYKNVVYNAKHELIFTIAKNFKNVKNLAATEGVSIVSIQLYMPRVEVSGRKKI